jgi:hypothetical protein
VQARLKGARDKEGFPNPSAGNQNPGGRKSKSPRKEIQIISRSRIGTFQWLKCDFREDAVFSMSPGVKHDPDVEKV